MPEYTMLILWIALLIAFIVVEAATVQLVTIWFAVGAAAALISEHIQRQIRKSLARLHGLRGCQS